MSRPKVLFINGDRIGDCVMMSAALPILRDQFPSCAITMACGPHAAPLFRAAPGIDRIIPLPKKKAGMHWLDLYRQVAATHWDLVVDIRGSSIAWLLRARERRVYNRSWETGRHKVEMVSRMMLSDLTGEPEIVLDDAARACAEEIIGADPAPIIALAPIASLPIRSWPLDRWAGLVERLKAEPRFDGWRIMMVGGPGDREAAAPSLAIAGERGIDCVGKSDILASAAAIGRAALFVGNDSGLMHVSAAMGTPTLGVFGPSEWWHKAPWGPNGRVVAAAPERGTYAPIEALDVDQVFAATVALYDAFIPGRDAAAP